MKLKLRKLASNTLYLSVNWVGITSLSFFFWIIIGKLLKPEELGAFSTSYNLATALSFITILGIGTAIYKLIPEYLVRKLGSKIPSLVKFSFKAVLIANLLFIFIFILAKDPISFHLKLNTQLILITLIMTVLIALTNMFGYVLLGFQDMKAYTTINVSSQIIRVTLTAILTIFGLSFFGPLVGTIMALVAMLLFQFISLSFIFFQKIKSKWDDYKELYEYSRAAFIGRLSTSVFNNSPAIILTLIKNLTITGIFTPALTLTSPLSILPLVFNSALFPIISGFSAKVKSVANSSILLGIILRYILLVSLPIAIFLITLSTRVVVLLFRPEYLEAAQILKFLAIGVLLYGISNVFLSSIYAMKKPNIQQNILLLTTITFLSSSLILTYYFSLFGMVAAYVMTSILQFSVSFIYSKKILDLKLPYYDIMKIIFAGIIMFTFVYILDNYIGNLFSLLLVIPASVLYIIILRFVRFYNLLDVRLADYIYVKSPTFIRKFISPMSSFIKNSATAKSL